MTVRGSALSRGNRWVAATIAAVAVCSAAGIALASTGAVVTSRDNQQLGPLLTGRNLHTLYLFHQDWGGKSYCYDTCAATWTPDITYGPPTTPSSSDLNSKLLGTIRRKNGTHQVTYNGHPLYFYKGDTQAGTANGEALYQFHGRWYAVKPNGTALKPFNPGQY